MTTCFKPGGGLAGRRDEFIASRQRAQAFLASDQLSCSLDSFDSPASELVKQPNVPPISAPSPLDVSVSLDSDSLNAVQAFSAMSITLPTKEIDCFDLYNIFHESFSPLWAMSGINGIAPYAFAAISSRFNALLDSGCTHHLFNDRSVFLSLDFSTKFTIRTANCGSMNALARGTVSFNYEYKGRSIQLNLSDCLYVPNVLIVLLLVRALNKKGMEVVFKSDVPVATLSFPSTHPTLPGFEMCATRDKHLYWLNLDFVKPMLPLIPEETSMMAYPAFHMQVNFFVNPRRRLGHLGHEATRLMLSKNFTTGISVSGSLGLGNCVACIIGKSPQNPYSSHSSRAESIGNLLHMDGCGPFAKMSFTNKTLFVLILDDCSNWGFYCSMANRTEILKFVQSVEALIRQRTGKQVKAMRFDGALEFSKGALGHWLVEQGISIQLTAPYAHSQNGKAERYVRTVEESAQTLLAASGLTLGFYDNAANTGVYLRNRVSSSVLPPETTPFELMHVKKPDLSHLHVWGCQCFVWLPHEQRKKGDLSRFEAIFVGYEEDRVGWHVRRLNGTYTFSRDVIFNEDMSAHFSIPKAVPKISIPAIPDDVPSRCKLPSRNRVRTEAGCAFNELIVMRNTRVVTQGRQKQVALSMVADPGNGGVMVDDVIERGLMCGGVHLHNAAGFLLFSLLASTELDAFAPVELEEFPTVFQLPALNVLTSSKCLDLPSKFRMLLSPTTCVTPSHDLSKAPKSYNKVLQRPDSALWLAAMKREIDSLMEMGAFEETVLPEGEKTVGLKWVFAMKTDADGNRIEGKEKARVVAQGFSQTALQFDETYVPVARDASVRMILAFAAVNNLEIQQFDCVTTKGVLYE